MTATLPQVSVEHHERLMHHVDLMPATGDLVGAAPLAELRPQVDEMAGFLTGCSSRTWTPPSARSTRSSSACSRTATR